MNLFVVLKNATGALELVTPPLDGMILPGITRDSVLTIAREHVSGVRPLPKLPRKLTVTERPITMKEFQNAAESGSLLEMFGTGMPTFENFQCESPTHTFFDTKAPLLS